jgi:hypothetical protein
MSNRTSILENNWTAYPNELIRNHNKFLTKNERNLMIFLWDRLYGYDYSKNELSYSLILKDCQNFPKNNRKLSEAIQGLEKKGLLKVYRKYEKTNKYYIGEKQYNRLQWYGKVFKGWKTGEEIELPQELLDNEETEIQTNEPQENLLEIEPTKKEIKKYKDLTIKERNTMFPQYTDCENALPSYILESSVEVEIEPPKIEPKKIKDLTIEERNTMFPRFIGQSDLPPFVLELPIEKALRWYVEKKKEETTITNVAYDLTEFSY